MKVVGSYVVGLPSLSERGVGLFVDRLELNDEG